MRTLNPGLLGFFLLAAVVQAQPQPPATASAAVWVGRILTPERKPVEGAKVSLIREFNLRGEPALAEVMTDADGRFRLPAPVGIERPYLAAQADGFGVTFARAAPAGADELAETIMNQSTELTVQFVGPDGLPAAGVAATITRVQSQRMAILTLTPFSAEMRREFTQVSDEQGICRIPGLPQGETAILDVVDERYAKIGRAQFMRLGDAISTNGGVLRLDPAGSIAGRLFYQDTGRPVVGVTVGANGEMGAGMESSHNSDVTDDDGRFVIRQLRTGTYVVSPNLSSDVLSKHAHVSLASVSVTAGQATTGKDIPLVPGEIIRGKVTVAGTGRPLAGVSVMNVLTRDDGSYEARALPGSRTVHIYLRQMEHVGRFTENQTSREVMIVAGQINTIDFEMVELTGAGVKGQVLDVEGNPVAGAMVTLEVPGTHAFRNASAYATSDNEGNYLIPIAAVGAQLRAQKGTLMTAKAEPVTDSRVVNLVILKDITASIRLVVTTLEGVPVTGVKVTLMEPMGRGRVSSEERLTRPDGSVLIQSLMPGEKYGLQIGGNGYSRTFMEDLVLQPGQQRELVATVRLATASIAGMVVDSDGKPVPDVMVRVDCETVDLAYVRSDSQGKFRFDGLLPEEPVSVLIEFPDRRIGESTRSKAGDMNVIVRNVRRPIAAPRPQGELIAPGVPPGQMVVPRAP